MVEAVILPGVSDLLGQLRDACGAVAERARYVRIDREAIPSYAASLPLDALAGEPDPEVHMTAGTPEDLAAFWLTLDAINFGSGWFPTLSKRDGRSGYYTIAGGVRGRFATAGPWSADELAQIERTAVAEALGQDPGHELMGLFARSLNDLGRNVAAEHGGRFGSVIDSAGASAEALVELLAGWDCFADASDYEGLRVPFLKRAQITAADLVRGGAADFGDLDRLTMFADNLVPHVLRLDGILRYDTRLSARIDRAD